MLKGVPYSLDHYVQLGRHREVNYGDGTANATTSLYLGTVPASSDVEVRVDVKTAFNGSTPSLDMVAKDSDGNVLATILNATVIAATTAQNGTIGRYYPTTDCELFLEFHRPASGNTTGQAVAVAKWLANQGQDSVL